MTRDAVEQGFERYLTDLVDETYEAFDVADISPMLLVDRVGGLAEHNLQVLIEYLQQRTDYLVSTAYPAFDASEANLIDPERWSVATPS